MLTFRFLFDQHVNARALKQLRAAGIDVVHVAEVGLSEADDPDIFARSIDLDRIVVTRNYRDLAPLVEAYARRGLGFPGSCSTRRRFGNRTRGTTSARFRTGFVARVIPATTRCATGSTGSGDRLA